MERKKQTLKEVFRDGWAKLKEAVHVWKHINRQVVRKNRD